MGSRTSVPFGQNVRKNLACGPSLENVMFLHTQDAFFLANPLFLPSIAFDLPLPNFWITISAISITIDRGLISWSYLRKFWLFLYISTEVALRSPMTYDNHLIRPSNILLWMNKTGFRLIWVNFHCPKMYYATVVRLKKSKSCQKHL